MQKLTGREEGRRCNAVCQVIGNVPQHLADLHMTSKMAHYLHLKSRAKIHWPLLLQMCRIYGCRYVYNRCRSKQTQGLGVTFVTIAKKDTNFYLTESWSHKTLNIYCAIFSLSVGARPSCVLLTWKLPSLADKRWPNVSYSDSNVWKILTRKCLAVF